MFGFYDSTIIFLIPALIISAYAQNKIASTYNKYSKLLSSKGYSGAEVARILLDENGLYDVPVEVISGRLSDHYDPSKRVMRLSQGVYYGTSVADIGVAAHETGHAIQHKNAYFPLVLRNRIVPIVNFSSRASWILFLMGFMFGYGNLINIGIILFMAVVVFQLITLPVEYDASRRALNILENRSILLGDEIVGAKKVLSAAAMTYVASALMAISQLIRLLALSGRRRD